MHTLITLPLISTISWTFLPIIKQKVVNLFSDEHRLRAAQKAYIDPADRNRLLHERRIPLKVQIMDE
jgi:hypothetical protein